MLYCTVLCLAVLHCTLLYCATLYCTTLYCATQYHMIWSSPLRSMIRHYTALYFTMYSTVLRCVRSYSTRSPHDMYYTTYYTMYDVVHFALCFTTALPSSILHCLYTSVHIYMYVCIYIYIYLVFIYTFCKHIYIYL